ncbi:MAG: hypothetical protein ABW042_02040, partial [Phenylobacterium sp.]
PMGIGWHPWFRIPSGRREQVRLRLPADGRAPANNYDEVLPTGAVEPVEGTAFDFRAPRALGDLYLDDCFTRLVRNADGQLACEFRDPASAYGLSIVSDSPGVKAIQVYAPPDRPVVVLEPQFNLADPYSAAWDPSVDTGMQRLPPGAEIRYEVRLSLLPANI